MHAVRCLEEFSGQGEQFSVAGVIERLDRSNPRRNGGLVLLEPGLELALRIRRPRDQYRSGVRQVLSNPFQESRIHGRVSAVPGVCLVMDVLVRMSASHDGGVDLRGVELEYFRLLVIDPDDRVVEVAHG